MHMNLRRYQDYASRMVKSQRLRSVRRCPFYSLYPTLPHPTNVRIITAFTANITFLHREQCIKLPPPLPATTIAFFCRTFTYILPLFDA